MLCPFTLCICALLRPSCALAGHGKISWYRGGGIAGFVGNPGEIVMVRLQGDFVKPLEKRFNYKNCFDALFRMVREEGPSSFVGGVGPNVFCVILMNTSQLAYDFFKAELLKTRYFEDNIMCHFTASFAAGTVATTVCSPRTCSRFIFPLPSQLNTMPILTESRVCAQSHIMNASGPGSNLMLGVIRTSFQTEGAMFMLKGWVPAWTRLQPTTILIFLTLEQLTNGVDWMRGRGFEVL
ncbi:mitochondrial carrier domain-containing protein [Mycena leptocephala]|nr:mitochondrial carrier domain-containing protein [Mycena leptocephala]